MTFVRAGMGLCHGSIRVLESVSVSYRVMFSLAVPLQLLTGS